MSLITQQTMLGRAVVAGEAVDGVVVGRLHIYRQAYVARLTAALRDNFGVVPRVVGDVGFDTLALAYIAAHPSTHPSIRWFGERLPEFIAAHADLVPHAAVVDLARLEWALRSAFDAADALPLRASDLEEIASEAWPNLVFVPMPGVQLLRMQWNIGPAWRALQGSEEPELPEPQALDHWVLIWRQGLGPRWRTVDERMATLLQHVTGGMAFADLCARTGDTMPDDEAVTFVAGALRSWIEDGLLRR